MAKIHTAVGCRRGATRHPVFVAALVLMGATSIGCRASVVRSGPVEPTPVSARRVIPTQTMVETRLNQSIGTDINRPGDRFTATVISDVVLPDGALVIPAGALVMGVVTHLDPSTGVGDQAAIGLGFTGVAFDGERYPFSADIVQTEVVHRHDTGDVATGAAAGALGGAFLGAILGGGSGALKGGLAGAAGGTLIGLGTGDVQAVIPAGSRLVLRMSEPLYFSPPPHQEFEEEPEELEGPRELPPDW